MISITCKDVMGPCNAVVRGRDLQELLAEVWAHVELSHPLAFRGFSPEEKSCLDRMVVEAYAKGTVMAGLEPGGSR